MKVAHSLTFVLAAAMLAGCQPRIKSLESNESAMTPNPKAQGKTIDPYTYGGIAGATGGTQTQTRLNKPEPAPAPVPGQKAPGKK
jgi:hypothetical protein